MVSIKNGNNSVSAVTVIFEELTLNLSEKKFCGAKDKVIWIHKDTHCVPGTHVARNGHFILLHTLATSLKEPTIWRLLILFYFIEFSLSLSFSLFGLACATSLWLDARHHANYNITRIPIFRYSFPARS